MDSLGRNKLKMLRMVLKKHKQNRVLKDSNAVAGKNETGLRDQCYFSPKQFVNSSFSRLETELRFPRPLRIVKRNMNQIFVFFSGFKSKARRLYNFNLLTQNFVTT